MTDHECPDAIQVATDAFYAALGGQQYAKTSTGALADVNFSLMTDYTNRLSAAVNAAGANADIAQLATEVFTEMFPAGNFQPLGNGAVADVNFSMLTQFSNQLNARLISAEACQAPQRI